jgi:hypothetical protein
MGTSDSDFTDCDGVFPGHGAREEASDMDISPLQTSDPTAWTERFVATLHSQRINVREFLVARQTRIEQSIALLEELIERLTGELENRSATMAAEESDAEAAEHDFERRYELALDDLRELKVKNAELQQQLARAKSSVSVFGGAGQTQSESHDWESLKRHILSVLESDFNESDSEQHAERLKIETVVQLTDNAIAEKDRAIEELQRQLKEAGEAKAADIAETAATAQLFDADATIQAERERLRQLQEQWKDKMRQAEIEVSLERAKLTRQRVEIEERLRVVENEQSQSPQAAPAKGARPVQRWRVRLGLGDPE